MNIIDESNIICGDDIHISKGIVIHQPTIKEILKFGEKEYSSLINSLTSEPFDMPYYLSCVGIDFAKITPFELFCQLVSGIPKESSALLFGDLDFTEFKVIVKENDIVLANKDGVIIDSLIRDRIADILRKMHNLPKNIITSCENEFTHDLLISQQKKEIERAKRRVKMFGESSGYVPLVSSLACEWKSYDDVLNLPIGQFYDALVRLGYRINAQNLYHGIYAGSISYKNINKKDLDWMRPIKIKTL